MAGRLFAILLVLVGTSEIAAECFAWGATGHEWVSGIAIEKLGSGTHYVADASQPLQVWPRVENLLARRFQNRAK